MERGVIYCEEIVNLFHAHYTVGYYTVDGWLIGWSVSPPPPPPLLKKNSSDLHDSRKWPILSLKRRISPKGD